MATSQRLNAAYGIDNPLQALATLPIQAKRAPTPRDKAQVGQMWVDKLTNTVYVCTSIVSNVTNWTNLVGSGTGIFPALQITTLSNTMLIADLTGHIISPGAATNGQVLIGSTGAAPALSTLTAGAGIAITNAAGSITISSPGGGISWTIETVDQGMVADHGYICNKAGLVTLTLPAVAAVGDTMFVTCKNVAAGWKIAQHAGQTLHGGTASSTTGVAGFAASTALYDFVQITCITANTDFVIIPMMGAISIA